MQEVLERSLKHCHAANVHSIMLLECPGKTIRLFVAEPGHRLGGNHPAVFEEHQSVSFHAHHCDLTLIPTGGNVFNWLVDRVEIVGWAGMEIDPSVFMANEFQYRSAITHGKIGFEQVDRRLLKTVSFERMEIGAAVAMPSTAIHTVHVPENEWGAWLALEGRENPDHDNRCWSKTRADLEDFGGFYQPMTPDELKRIMGHSGLGDFGL